MENLTNFLVNKKVLLFSPKFFGYQNDIKNTLEKFGATVFYYDERPSNSFLTKSLIRLNFRKIINTKIHKYYKNIIENIDAVDYIFIISPESISKNEIILMRKKFPSCKIIVYLWDSLKNKPIIKSYFNYIDKIFSFDQDDCRTELPIEFLPLFYNDHYKTMISSDIKYDISFIGTIHSDRFFVIDSIRKFAERNKLSTYFYFYCPHPLVFLYKKYITRELKYVPAKYISYVPLSRENVLDIISKSSIIIDVEHKNQNGLTMRTIEILGARKKLITTNHNIKSYDFYIKDNIHIISRDNPCIDNSFIKSNYIYCSNELYYKYSLDSWVKKIFN